MIARFVSLILAVSLLAWSAPAWAAPRALVRTHIEEAGFVGFVDVNTLQRTGNTVTGEIVITVGDREAYTNGLAYVVMHFTTDCRTRLVRRTSQIGYSGIGGEISRLGPGPVNGVDPTTLGVICGDGDGRGVSTRTFDNIEAAWAYGDRSEAPLQPTGAPPTGPATPLQLAYVAAGDTAFPTRVDIFTDVRTVGRRADGLATVWTLYVWRKPIPQNGSESLVAYSMSQVTYNCAQRTYQFSVYRNYSAEGTLVGLSEVMSPFAAIREPSSDVAELEFACRPPRNRGRILTTIDQARTFSSQRDD